MIIGGLCYCTPTVGEKIEDIIVEAPLELLLEMAIRSACFTEKAIPREKIITLLGKFMSSAKV